MKRYNVYCDESCHLEKDTSPIMILGAMYCQEDRKKQIYDEIRAIKTKHNISSFFEIKWTKVSESKIDFYLELLDYFWNNQDLLYRGLVASGKQSLDHDKYNGGDYDLWYYKMYYRMLDPVISPNDKYHIMVDIKDTRGREKLDKIQQVFDNKFHGHSPFTYFQHIRSHESQFIQLTDLLIGAVCYKARGMEAKPNASEAKIKLIEHLEQKSGYVLNEGTEPSESKFNIFNHQPRRQ